MIVYNRKEQEGVRLVLSATNIVSSAKTCHALDIWQPKSERKFQEGKSVVQLPGPINVEKHPFFTCPYICLLQFENCVGSADNVV